MLSWFEFTRKVIMTIAALQLQGGTCYAIDFHDIKTSCYDDNDTIDIDTTYDYMPYELIESMPSFPGGALALMDYVSKNIQYPKDAIKKEIQGRVVVSFTIETDGSTSNHKVIRGIYPSLDQEAIRVVKSMPKWQPAYCKGKRIRTKYYVPIPFRLDPK